MSKVFVDRVAAAASAPGAVIPSGGHAALLHAFNRGGRTGVPGEWASKLPGDSGLNSTFENCGTVIPAVWGATASGVAANAAQLPGQALLGACSQPLCTALPPAQSIPAIAGEVII